VVSSLNASPKFKNRRFNRSSPISKSLSDNLVVRSRKVEMCCNRRINRRINQQFKSQAVLLRCDSREDNLNGDR